MEEKQPPTNPQYDPPPPYSQNVGGSGGAPPYPEGGGQQQPPFDNKAPPVTQQPYYQHPPQQQHISGGVPVNTMTTTVVMAAPMMGPYPVNMVCPKCQAQIVTETRPMTGLLTWLVAGGLCLVGCWLGCCLIPFCVDELQDCEHRCPNCKQYVGTYKRL